jgi:hypothetical protein
VLQHGGASQASHPRAHDATSLSCRSRMASSQGQSPASVARRWVSADVLISRLMRGNAVRPLRHE